MLVGVFTSLLLVDNIQWGCKWMWVRDFCLISRWWWRQRVAGPQSDQSLCVLPMPKDHFPYGVACLFNRNELTHDKTYNKKCMTSKDSAQPVHPPSMARVLVHLSLNNSEAVEGVCNQRRLWTDCADARHIVGFIMCWLKYFIYTECWDILTSYHTCPKI